MRKLTEIAIDGRKFMIKELTVRQVWSIFNQEEGAEAGDHPVKTFLAMACPDLTEADVMDMAPSELKTLWDAFREVNADFLELARTLGGDAIIERIVATVKASILGTISGSLTSTAASAP